MALELLIVKLKITKNKYSKIIKLEILIIKSKWKREKKRATHKNK